MLTLCLSYTVTCCSVLSQTCSSYAEPCVQLVAQVLMMFSLCLQAGCMNPVLMLRQAVNLPPAKDDKQQTPVDSSLYETADWDEDEATTAPSQHVSQLSKASHCLLPDVV